MGQCMGQNKLVCMGQCYQCYAHYKLTTTTAATIAFDVRPRSFSLSVARTTTHWSTR